LILGAATIGMLDVRFQNLFWVFYWRAVVAVDLKLKGKRPGFPGRHVFA